MSFLSLSNRSVRSVEKITALLGMSLQTKYSPLPVLSVNYGIVSLEL